MNINEDEISAALNQFDLPNVAHLEKNIPSNSFPHDSFVACALGLKGCVYKPADQIKFIGEAPSDFTKNRLYELYDAKTIGEIPYLDVFRQVRHFLSLYDYKEERRGRPVTTIETKSLSSGFVPYIIAYYCLRDENDRLGASISVENGSVHLTFKIKKTVADALKEPRNSRNVVLLSECRGTEAWRFLIEWIHYIEETEFESAILNVDFHVFLEEIGDFIVFSYDPDNPYLMGLPLRACRYLKQNGPTSKSELAEYFNVTPRRMGYILEQLVARGRIRMVGSRNSPKLTYEIVNNR